MIRIGDVQRSKLSRLYPEDQALMVQLKKGSEAKSAFQAHQSALNGLLRVRQVQVSQPLSSIIEEIGRVIEALTTGGTTRLPHVEDPVTGMPYYNQGNTNGCGTTSLAMIMTYLGVPMTEGDIDKVIRRMDIFSAPTDLVDFARDHGLEAEGYNHGSWEEVKSMIDQGCPVEALIQSDTALGGSANGQHYVAITGYEKDAVTGKEYVLYHDPNLGSEQRIPVEDFKKMWGNVGFGFDNYFMAFGPKGTHLPPGRDDGIEGVLGTLGGVTNITNGLNRIFHPDCFDSFVHGIPQFVGGVFQTVGCGVGALLQLGAGWLNHAVDGIPVLQNIVQPFGDIVNGFGAAVGDVGRGIGNAFNHVGGAFESLFHGNVGGFVGGVGKAVGDVASGVGKAIGNVASGIGHAVKDFFSGW